MSEVFKSLDMINGKLEHTRHTEDNFSDLEVLSVKTIQNEIQGQKWIF